MNGTAKIVSLIALCAVVVPCVVYLVGAIGLDVVKGAALVGTIGWFIATPMWMSRRQDVDASDVEMKKSPQ